jgi:hypothetical protein
MEKLKKQPNFYAREGEARSVIVTNKLMILLVNMKACFNTKNLDHVVPCVLVSSL